MITILCLRIEEGFDPSTYRLFAKIGYDLDDSLALSILPLEATDKKVHDLNPTQKMPREKGYAIESSKIVLGYFSHAPIQIKINRANNCCIVVEVEVEVSSVVDDSTAIDRLVGKTHSIFSSQNTEIIKQK